MVKQAEGKTESVLRKDVDEIKASTVSLMPDNLSKILLPRDVADILAWLRSPPNQVVLIDDDPALALLLNQGAGTAEFVETDRQRGRIALRITPPQRFSPHIGGWEYRIREHPGRGEFRYLRFAWKSAGAKGIMIELANSGAWPDAELTKVPLCGRPQHHDLASAAGIGTSPNRVDPGHPPTCGMTLEI